MASDQPESDNTPGAITLGFSLLTHVLLLAPVLYIVVLAFVHYSFFSWHPICMSIAIGLLVTEAIFSISGEAYMSSRLSRSTRVTVHWVLHTVGFCFLLIGFIIIIVNKNNANKYHFTTEHGKLGLSAIILTILTAAFGILTKNTRWLYPHVRPVLLKIVHSINGMAVLIILLATISTGTFTRWWPGSTDGRALTITSLVIAVFLILIKPILGAVSRYRVVFGPSSSGT